MTDQYTDKCEHEKGGRTDRQSSGVQVEVNKQGANVV